MNSENTHPLPDDQLQALYRRLLDAYIARAPAGYRQELRNIQERIDESHRPGDESAVILETLNGLFGEMVPACAPAEKNCTMSTRDPIPSGRNAPTPGTLQPGSSC
jgi:hypothetical protein